MTPDLLELLTDSERAAWALCEGASPASRWDRSWDEQPYFRDGYKRSKFAIGPQYGVPAHPNMSEDKERGAEVAAKVYADAAWMQDARTSLPLALTTIATLRHHLAEQQRAFVIGLDLAQRTADAEIAELRATLDNERGEGVPPSEGWTWLDGAWRILDDFGGCTLSVHAFDNGRWHWRQHDPPYNRSKFPLTSARSAMKAADAAVKGAT